MSTPNPTPIAEAMAALHELFDHSSYGWQEEALVIDRHFAPLREENERLKKDVETYASQSDGELIIGLQGLNIQNEEIIHTLTDDRDALRKRVDALEAALASEAFNSNLAIFEHKSRITSLEATVQALEGEVKDTLPVIRSAIMLLVELEIMFVPKTGHFPAQIAARIKSLQTRLAALATHSEGKETP